MHALGCSYLHCLIRPLIDAEVFLIFVVDDLLHKLKLLRESH